MKTKTTITDITQKDLVNLLCNATFYSSWLTVRRPMGSYNGTELKNEEDSIEDAWVKVLLGGKKVYVLDYNAEDEDEFYGHLPHKFFDYDEGSYMRYELTLEDIRKGLQNAVDGTFKHSGGEHSLVKRVMSNMLSDDGDYDNPYAELIMQIIVFNEVIY